jgi:hypothetical protein
MADSTASFTIKSDIGKLQADLGTIVEGLGQVSSGAKEAGSSTNAAMDGAAASTQKFSNELKVARSETATLLTGVRSLKEGVEGLAPALGLVGPAAVEGAEGVAYLAKALTSLMAAAPELLIITAALAAVVAAMNTLKDGVESASKLNESLDQIAANLHLTGAAADSTKDQIKEFADALGSSTGAGAEQTVAAIQKMTAAHIPLNTAMQLTKDAELESIASGRDSASVQDALMNAVLGRTRGLVALGVITKEEAKNGISLDEVNRRILDSTAQSVEQYQNSLPGALAISSENFKQLITDLSSGLVPVLVSVIQGVNDGIETFKQFADAVGPYVTAAIHDVQEALAALRTYFAPVGDDFENLGNHAKAALASIVTAAVDFYNAFKPQIDGVMKVLGEVVDFIGGAFLDEIKSGLMLVIDSFSAMFDEIKTEVDFFIGVFTENWKKFHDDINVLASDGLKILNDIFSGQLANIVGAVDTAIDQIKEKFNELKGLMGDLQQGNFIGAGQVAHQILGLNTDQMGQEFKEHSEAFKKWQHSISETADKVTKAEADSLKWPSGGGASKGSGVPGNLQIRDQEIGGSDKAAKAPKEKYDSEPIQEATNATSKYTASQAELETKLHDVDAALDQDRAAVQSATTVTEENAAKAKLAADSAAALAQEHTLLQGHINLSNGELKQLNSTYADQKEHLDRVTASYNAFDKEIVGKDKTPQLTQELKEHKDAVEAAQKAYDKTAQSIKEVTSIRDKDTASLQANAKAQAEAKNALDAFLLSQDRQKTQLAETLNDEIKTYNLSTAAQITYYEQKLSLLDSSNAADWDSIKEYEDKVAQLQKKYIDESLEAQKKAIDAANEARKKSLEDATKDFDVFFDDVLQKHKTFGSALKDVMATIEKQYAQSFSQMITGSSGFQSLFGLGKAPDSAGQGKNPQLDQMIAADQANTLAVNKNTQPTIDLKQPVIDLKTSTDNAKTSTDSNTTNVQTNTTAINALTTAVNKANSSSQGGGSDSGGGGFTADLGNAGSGSWDDSSSGGLFSSSNQVLGSLFNVTSGGAPSSASMLSAIDLSPTSIAHLTGSTSGVSPMSFTALQNTLPATSTSSSGGGKSVGAQDTGNYISGGLSLVQGLSSGGSFAQTLSGLGTVVGTALGGPVVGSIAGAVGGFLGSLFGNHTPAANEPDIYNTQAYGQGVADLLGNAGANGQSFTEDQNTLKAFNGATGLAGVEMELAKGQTQFMQDTGETAAQYQAALSMFGASATGSGKLNFDTNIGQQYVTGATGAGGTFSYATLDQTLSQIEQGLSTTGASDPTRVYGIKNTMPNFETTTIAQIGTFANGLYNALTPSGTSGGSTVSPVVRSNGSGTSINISVGTLVGSNGMSELANLLETYQLRNRFNNAYNMNGAY